MNKNAAMFKTFIPDSKPTTADTIVFRSYKDPDETSSTLTKLKVEYVNTVKTGGLKIQKKAADGEEENINRHLHLQSYL